MRFLRVLRNPYLFSIDYSVTKALENRHAPTIVRNSGLKHPLRKLAPLNSTIPKK
jgi:hypothetical protein